MLQLNAEKTAELPVYAHWFRANPALRLTQPLNGGWDSKNAIRTAFSTYYMSLGISFNSQETTFNVSLHDIKLLNKLEELNFQPIQLETEAVSVDSPKVGMYFCNSQFNKLGGTLLLLTSCRDRSNYYPQYNKSSFKNDWTVCEVYSTDPNYAYELIKLLSPLHSPRKNSNEGKVMVLVSDGGSLFFETIGRTAVPFTKENYNETVIDGYNYIKENLKKENPPGRIVLLDGPKGTGKTTLVRSMIGDVDNCNFIVIPSNMVESIGGPEFMAVFLRYRDQFNSMPIVLILEDADRCLVSRDLGNVSAISAILNMSDGIVGLQLDIRIVATTNQSLTDIDDAIKRPGRLLRHIHVGPLTPERASNCFRNLTGIEREFSSNEDTSLANIYREAFNKESAKNDIKPTRKVGFGA